MKHLNSEQMSAIVAGWSSSETEQQHALVCRECAAEIDHLRETLKLFRASIRDWSEGNCKSAVNVAPQSSPNIAPDRPHPRRVAWVLAAAGLAIAVAVPVYQDVRENELKAQEEADDRLIESVQNQLSRSAPVAMQPLVPMLIQSSDSNPKEFRTENGKERGAQ